MKKGLKLALGVSTAVVLAGANLVPSFVFAWGDSSGTRGRPSYTKEQIDAGAIDDKIVFNSISNGVIGDEKNFVAAREDGTKNTWQNNELSVEDGKTYVIRLYVHNNNRFGEKMTATGVKTTVNVPTTSGTSVEINGFVDADNATPKSIWDNVVLKASQNFHLDYVKGSAKIDNNGKVGGSTLSDSIVTSGTLIGFNSLDGKIPGCFNFASYITLKVKVTYDYDFEVSKKVRIKGESGWNESVTAKVGDEVEYQIHYKNNSSVVAKDVILKDILPGNLAYVNDSTVLYAGKYSKTGLKLESNGVTKDGINIGDYAAGAGAYVRFTAKVVDVDLGCGTNTLTNWAQVYVGENGTNEMKQDDADVLVAKTCSEPVQPVTPTDPTTPERLPETGAGEITGAVLGLGSLVTSAGYYLSSRKKLA